LHNLAGEDITALAPRAQSMIRSVLSSACQVVKKLVIRSLIQLIFFFPYFGYRDNG
jgi:hypothetical protein